MNRILVRVGIALMVVVLGMFAAGTVLAQSPTDTPAPNTPWGMAWGGICRGGSALSTTITDLLGMTPGEALDARLEGKTLLDLATEKGLTEEQLTDAIVHDRKAALDEAVADGGLTQEQADWMLERMKVLAPLNLKSPFGPFGGDGAQGGWMGGMHGGRFGGMKDGSFGGMRGMRDDFGPRGGMRGGWFGDTDGGWFGGMRGMWGPSSNALETPAPSNSTTL